MPLLPFPPPFGGGEGVWVGAFIITIDQDLIEAANLLEGEKVQIVNNNNGERLEPYIIRGERGSGIICLNGAAARRAQVGDVLIIIAYAMMTQEEAKTFKPTNVFPGENNWLVVHAKDVVTD